MIKRFFSSIYILAFMALTIGFMYLIWNVTFAHLVEEYHKRQQLIELKEIKDKKDKQAGEQTMFKKVILEESTKKTYLGYRVLEDQKIEGHFHHIDFKLGADKRSYCVTCHGDMPHDKIKAIRAFGNMHATFISCQVCHAILDEDKKTGLFKWYDRTTGEIVDSPAAKGGKPGTYTAKIISFERVNGQTQRIDSDERINFAREYYQNEKQLTEIQKSKAKKLIHNIVSRQPHACEDCHQKESPLLPFKELGFPSNRIDSIVSTEVVGMIKNYTKFYMPRILNPGFSEEENGNKTDISQDTSS